jgi:hypothetical protein
MKKYVKKYVVVVMEKYAVVEVVTKLECVIEVDMTAWVVYEEVVVYGYRSTEVTLVHHYRTITTDSTCFVHLLWWNPIH